MTALRLGDFVLGDVLGQGGMGVVFRATHQPTGLPVALKGITRAAGRKTRVLDSLRAEIRAAASLDHPAIASVLEHGVVDYSAANQSGNLLSAGSPWLAMELASDGSLRPWARAERPPLPWSGLRGLLLRLLDALAHAHARGVLHLDLKPENVLLAGDTDARPGLKLVDFGLARRLEPDPREFADTEQNDAAGTPLYMAPEQLEGKVRAFGPWTDLYAFGGLAWALATGAPSVTGGDLFAIAFAHLRGDRRPFRPRAPVPEGFEDWLEQLLARRPDRRFARAADAAFALANLGEPVETAVGDVPVLPPWGADTTTLGTLLQSEPTLPSVHDIAPIEPRRTHVAPPIPANWRESERARPLPQLVGAGLALWGLREQPVVDRERERDHLWSALRQVHARRQPRCVLLEGSAGCGKSRLASWLSRRAHEVGGAVTLRATHGPALGAQDGLGPMLARALGCVGLEGRELADHLAARLPQDAPRAAIAALIDPFFEWTFETPQQRWVAFGAALEDLTRHRPAVVWLDDLQWGTQAIRFATWVAASELPVLVVGTIRGEDVAEDTGAWLAELGELASVETLAVGALPPDDGLALVHELLDLEASLARQVADRTAGNPLFAVQLVGDWVERGLLEPTSRGFRLRAGARDSLPADLATVWEARVDGLLHGRPDGQIHGLELAAALGQVVDRVEWELLCARCGADASEDLLDDLLQAGLALRVDRGTEGSWSFVHGLLREAIEELADGRGRLASNHRACASMLSERGAGAQRLGPHLLAGESYESAATVLVEAARLAGRDESDLTKMRRLMTSWLQAQQLAGRAESHPSWLTGLLNLSHVERASGFLDKAKHWAERAMASSAARSDRRGEALSAVELGRVLMNQGDYDDAHAELTAALPTLDEFGEVESASDALRALGILHMARGQWVESADCLERSLLRAHASDHPTKPGFCHIALAQVERHQKHFDAAAQQLEAARVIFETAGYRIGRAEAANGRGELARLNGDLVTAEAAYREALELYTELGSIDVPVATANLGLVQTARGNWSAARDTLEDARRLFAMEKRLDLEAACCVALLAPDAAYRDTEAFDRHLGRALDLLDRTKFVYPDVAHEAERAGGLAAARGDRRRAEQAWVVALQQWEGLKRPVDVARVEGLLATLAASASP